MFQIEQFNDILYEQSLITFNGFLRIENIYGKQDKNFHFKLSIKKRISD